VFFSVQDLEQRKIHFDVVFPPGEIEFSDGTLKQVTPLEAQGVVELLNHTLGEIRIRGHLTVRMGMECDRCLEAAQLPVDSDFDLYYRPSDTGPDEEELEIDAGEAELAFYDGEGLELEEILREYVLLALPMQRICREDCKGICPVCGKNRNQIACECVIKSADDRWAALRNLKVKEAT
jgi:uncharacterized protein